MTRINLVPPSELSDQHLFAEWREIKMVPKALRRSLYALCGRTHMPREQLLSKLSKDFTLGTGHVMFFYDKGSYLHYRYGQLTYELVKRGINCNLQARLDPDGVFSALDVRFNRSYIPTPEALTLIRARIAEKIAMRPSWYRWSATSESTPLRSRA